MITAPRIDATSSCWMRKPFALHVIAVIKGADIILFLKSVDFGSHVVSRLILAFAKMYNFQFTCIF